MQSGILKKNWKTWATHLPLLFLMCLLAGCLNDDEEDGGGEVMLVKVGDAVPDFALVGSNGSEVSAASMEGKVYILNFFDTQCPDCQEEFKVLQQIYDKYQTLPVLNVPRSQTYEQVEEYWSRSGLTMPFYMPSDSRLYYQFATRTVPRTYVVNDNGKVHAAYDDNPVADFDTLDAELKALLGK